jgi:hypothetical protein
MDILEELFRHQQFAQILSAPGIVDVIMVEGKEASMNEKQEGVSSQNHPKENLQCESIFHFGGWKLAHWKDQGEQSMVDGFHNESILNKENEDYPVYKGQSDEGKA